MFPLTPPTSNSEIAAYLTDLGFVTTYHTTRAPQPEINYPGQLARYTFVAPQAATYPKLKPLVLIDAAEGMQWIISKLEWLRIFQREFGVQRQVKQLATGPDGVFFGFELVAKRLAAMDIAREHFAATAAIWYALRRSGVADLPRGSHASREMFHRYASFAAETGLTLDQRIDFVDRYIDIPTARDLIAKRVPPALVADLYPRTRSGRLPSWELI